ncbi:biotin synthase [Monosporozyma unispora]|nr:biotin synthase [Kazachstania unispora]
MISSSVLSISRKNFTRFVQTTATNTVILKALSLKEPKHDWTRAELTSIYEASLLELVHNAQLQHRKFHQPNKVQMCTLMSIKTGGCTEDCRYCAQASSNHTGIEAEKLVDVKKVVAQAKEAKEHGSTRFCLGAAWRDMNGRKSALRKISDMVSQVNELGLETCVTLGMINEEQSKQLGEAGLTAYNHNIDTSREHYKKVITSRTYDDRLKTIGNVQKSGVKVCSGGILGLGESADDRVGFLETLTNMNPHPDSVPINRLVPIKGTQIVEDLAKSKVKKLTFEDILRTIATARITMPHSIIRLAAGRYTMKEYEQIMCFMAGCNSIFSGKKMLTTLCNGWEEDKAMLAKWGLTVLEPFEQNLIKPDEE